MTSPEDKTVDELFAEAVAERGDVYDETRTILRVDPKAGILIRACAGYVHGYPGQTAPMQLLSNEMRELIALSQLCAMRDDRFAPSHVRRLYRHGVADDVILAAAEAIAPAVGHSTILHVALAIDTARDDKHPYGQMPAGGPPEESVDFRERYRWPATEVMPAPYWSAVAGRDLELSRRFLEFDEHCLGQTPKSSAVLCAGARELITIAALCARGLERPAARHMSFAQSLGVTVNDILEAVSCVLPMTGGATMEVCLDALAENGTH